jgi:hypothetical protein
MQPDHVESSAIRQSVRETAEHTQRHQANSQPLSVTRAEICKFVISRPYNLSDAKWC